MRIRLFAALGVVAILALLMAARGTTALWRAEVPVDAGIIRTGHLSLLTGDEETQTKAYRFPALSGTDFGAGNAAQAPLVTSNGGSVPLRFRLSGAADGTPSAVGPFQVRVTAVADSGVCRTGRTTWEATLPGSPVAAGPASSIGPSGWFALTPGASAAWCVRVGIPAGAPQPESSTGSAFRLSLALHAESTR